MKTRLRRGETVYIIDGAGYVREGTFESRHGRHVLVHCPASLVTAGCALTIARRDETFSAHVDAENFARQVRHWLTTPADMD